MWIFSPSGFVSAVKDTGEGKIVVRARDRASLESISSRFNSPIKPTPLADYPYRVLLGHDQFVDWVSNQATEIDYRNFKSEVAITRGTEFARTLSQVWSIMHEVEDRDARERSKE